MLPNIVQMFYNILYIKSQIWKSFALFQIAQVLSHHTVRIVPNSNHSVDVRCAVIRFMCFMLMQIDSPKELLSDEALGVHAAWVGLIEVAFAHKDASQPNPNTVHICVSLWSSGFRQSQWMQPQPSKELCEQLWWWIAILFLPMLPVSGFLFIFIYFYFLATLLSSNATWSKYYILYRHICFFIFNLSHQTPALIYSKSHSINQLLILSVLFSLWAKTHNCVTPYSHAGLLAKL